MKKVKRKILFLLLSGMWGAVNAQNNMVVEMKFGQTSNFLISGIQGLLVSDDESQLEIFTSSQNNVNISEIKKIYFSVVSGVEEEMPNEFLIFNALISNNLIVENTTGENHRFEIFDMGGRVVFSGNFIDGYNSIELSNLGNGLYVVKSDVQSFKFIKQ